MRLSGLDASFLYLECKEIPLHMAGVFLFDGPLPFEEFISRVASQLRFIPRYRQIVVVPPFNAGYPTWEDDPNFHIRKHVLRVHLHPPAGEAELEELCGPILSELMDRSKPLWDMRVVDGLEGGRGALIVRIHHSLADGIAGAGLVLKVILDSTPEGSRAPRKTRITRTHDPVPEPSLSNAIASGVYSSWGHLIDAGKGAVAIGQRLYRDPKGLTDALGLLPELVGAVERLPFNKPCSGERQFCWTDFDFSEVQAIREAAGGSVNDVVLTVLTQALARYLEVHGQTVANRLIRIVCPVNLRQDNGESLGNKLSFLPVALPLDVKDPVRMLEAVAARTAVMKKARAADLLAVVASGFGIAPPPAQAMLWRGISNLILPLPLFNLICTNIPGGPEPLYCVGQRLLAWYPQVPTGYELGINCAVTTSCGRLCFGLIADTQAAPDVTRLRDLLKVCFEKLCLAAGVRRPARRHTGHPVKPRRRAKGAAPR